MRDVRARFRKARGRIVAAAANRLRSPRPAAQRIANRAFDQRIDELQDAVNRKRITVAEIDDVEVGRQTVVKAREIEDAELNIARRRFDELVKPHRTRLRQVAGRYLRTAKQRALVDEVVQEALRKVWAQLRRGDKTLDDIQPGLLVTATGRCALDAIARAAEKAEACDFSKVAHGIASDSSTVDQLNAKMDLVRYARHLPAWPHRKVFYLRFVLGMAPREIERLIGLASRRVTRITAEVIQILSDEFGPAAAPGAHASTDTD